MEQGPFRYIMHTIFLCLICLSKVSSFIFTQDKKVWYSVLFGTMHVLHSPALQCFAIWIETKIRPRLYAKHYAKPSLNVLQSTQFLLCSNIYMVMCFIADNFIHSPEGTVWLHFNYTLKIPVIYIYASLKEVLKKTKSDFGTYRNS